MVAVAAATKSAPSPRVAAKVRAVALAIAARGQVDGDDDRLEAGGDGLPHQRPRHPGVGERVKLEPATPTGRGGGSFLHAGALSEHRADPDDQCQSCYRAQK